MQRPRFHLVFTLLFALLAIYANAVVAGEYTYAMAASESDDAPAVADATPPTGVGTNNRVEGMSARYLVSRDDVPVASERRSDDQETSSAAQQATVPSGSSGPASDKRASHRWQSLAPGAIK